MVGFVFQSKFQCLAEINVLVNDINALFIGAHSGVTVTLLCVFIQQRDTCICLAHVDILRVSSYRHVHLEYLVIIFQCCVLIAGDGCSRTGNFDGADGNQYFLTIRIIEQRFITRIECCYSVINIGYGVCIIGIFRNDIFAGSGRRFLNRIRQNTKVIRLVIVKIDDGFIREIIHSLGFKFLVVGGVFDTGEWIAQLFAVAVHQRNLRNEMGGQKFGGCCLYFGLFQSGGNLCRSRNTQVCFGVLVEEFHLQGTGSRCIDNGGHRLSADSQVCDGIGLQIDGNVFTEPAQNGSRLRTGGLSGRVQQQLAIGLLAAVDELVLGCPCHGADRPAGSLSRIREIQRALYRRFAGIVVQELRKLFTGDLAIGVEQSVAYAGGNIVCTCPLDGIVIPCVACHILKGCAAGNCRFSFPVVQNLYHHSTVHDGFRLENGGGGTCHQVMLIHIADRIVIPRTGFDIGERQSGLCLLPFGLVFCKGCHWYKGTYHAQCQQKTKQTFFVFHLTTPI